MVCYPNNRITRLDGRDVKTFDSTHGLNAGNVIGGLCTGEACLVWDASSASPALTESASSPYQRIRQPIHGSSGIVGTKQKRDLWLNESGDCAVTATGGSSG